eukprot:COSAG06_NODE_1258_length_10078_cov_2.895280_2_plen_504_part_00
MAGWSKLTQVELRALLRSRVQPADGSKAALVQRLTAFLSDGSEATGDDDVGEGDGPSASETAELEAAGASTELSAWRAAKSHLDDLTTSLAQQRAQARAEARAAQLAEGQAKVACAKQRATVKSAAAAARAVLHPHRVRHDEQTCQLLQLVGQDDLRPTFMQAEVWGVVGLWRLRGVCRAFRRWARTELSSLPRLVAVGGLTRDSTSKLVATASVESLDLSTMRWSAAGCMPSLPDPRAAHSVSCCADGRVVVCCGYNHGGADQMLHLASTALQWLPGTAAWSALPGLPGGRINAASVRLPDGQTMLIGGQYAGQALASVLVLAADGSGWSDLPPLTGTRIYPAAALLPDGKVLVAGGKTGRSDGTALNTAELWDPATQKWTALPPMAHKRAGAAACVLPSGRVAVLGGWGTDSVDRKDGEVFDPVKREWEPLGAERAHSHSNISTVAVAGGLIVVGGATVPEMYDEESGRWFTLPHAMVQQRKATGLVPVAAAALKAAAATR